MRGKAPAKPKKSISIRITPAYAGKRLRSTDFSDVDRDHPRLCGEKTARSRGRIRFLGSPPPMRGKASPHSCRKSYAGITPAYAGKSPAPSKGHRPLWDHPRLCGEKDTTDDAEDFN